MSRSAKHVLRGAAHHLLTFCLVYLVSALEMGLFPASPNKKESLLEACSLLACVFVAGLVHCSNRTANLYRDRDEITCSEYFIVSSYTLCGTRTGYLQQNKQTYKQTDRHGEQYTRNPEQTNIQTGSRPEQRLLTYKHTNTCISVPAVPDRTRVRLFQVLTLLPLLYQLGR